MADEFGVEITGLSDFTARLEKATSNMGPAVSKLTDELAQEIAAATRTKLPSATGAARSSVAVMHSALDASVVYGGSRAPYTPWLDFGGDVGIHKSVHRPYLKHGRALYPSLVANRELGMQQASDMITELLTSEGIVVTDV